MFPTPYNKIQLNRWRARTSEDIGIFESSFYIFGSSKPLNEKSPISKFVPEKMKIKIRLKVFISFAIKTEWGLIETFLRVCRRWKPLRIFSLSFCGLSIPITIHSIDMLFAKRHPMQHMMIFIIFSLYHFFSTETNNQRLKILERSTSLFAVQIHLLKDLKKLILPTELIGIF